MFKQIIKDVRVFQGSTAYKLSIDYIVDSSAGVIKRVRNSSIAENIAVQFDSDLEPEMKCHNNRFAC